MEAYLVTDRRLVAADYLPHLIRRAAEAGVNRIQIREKDLAGRALLALARESVEATRGCPATVFINDRVDVALLSGASGVHLGRAGLPPEVARRIGGESLVVGASAHTLEEALEAERGGADYLIFGPVFETPSKSAFGPPVGVPKLEAVVRKARIPVYAIGGIRLENLDVLRPLPLAGVAMVSAFVRAVSVAELVREVQRPSWS